MAIIAKPLGRSRRRWRPSASAKFLETDQAAQFTSVAFYGPACDRGHQDLDDGNRFQRRCGIGEWMMFYDTRPCHQLLGYEPPIWGPARRLWTWRYVDNAKSVAYVPTMPLA
jgi:hypothetical protein